MLRWAHGAFLQFAGSRRDDPNAEFCEGLIDWFSGNVNEAHRRFHRVTSMAGAHALAWAYKSMAVSQAQLKGDAIAMASRAVQIDRNSGLAHVALAWAHLKKGQATKASIEATHAQKLSATLLLPKVVTADTLASADQSEKARALLSSVLESDPSYREAHVVLYKRGL